MRLCPNISAQCILVSAVVSATFSQDGPAEVFRRTHSLVPAMVSAVDGFSVGNGIKAPARIVDFFGGDRLDLHVSGDLAQQLGQHGRIADGTTSDLEGPDF